MAQFDSDNQPENRRGRGKSFKTKLLDSIRRQSLFDLPLGSTEEQAEEAFLDHLARRASNPDDNNSAMLLKELLGRSYPSLKSQLPKIELKIDSKATPAEKATAILDSVAKGHVSPDVGGILIQAVKSMVDIESATDLKERIEKIEEALGIG